MAGGDASPFSRETLVSSRDLAARLPELLVAARRVAANVMYGVHGRRRSGPGETFWQFRPYIMGEPARRIDWRRSARDRHLYVREREWEAAQTVWLWADMSRSMYFRSQLSDTTKIDRTIVLLLALADLLARGGERVGMPGLVAPQIGGDAAGRFARALDRSDGNADWPPLERINRHSELVILSDFIWTDDSLSDRIGRSGSSGANLHLMQIFDPAEETFPYDGRVEFRDPESGQTWLAERAGSIRDEYRARLHAHRSQISRAAKSANSTFGVHHTDRPATEGLMFLYQSLSEMHRTGPSQSVLVGQDAA